MQPQLEWRPCPDFPEYEISESGQICRCIDSPHNGPKAGTLIISKVGNSGYLQVQLGAKRSRRMLLLHRLVLRAFIGEPPTKKHVAAHNDGNRFHNHWSNLRWAMQAENHADKIAHGTHLRGEAVGGSKLRAIDVPRVREAALFGAIQRDLAQAYGVSQGCIQLTIARKNWAHI